MILIISFKGKNNSKNTIDFKGSLGFLKSIRDGDTALAKGKENQKKTFKSELIEIVRGGHKSREQGSTIENIKILYESREKVISWFADYSAFESEAKYESSYGKTLKILDSEQIF